MDLLCGDASVLVFEELFFRRSALLTYTSGSGYFRIKPAQTDKTDRAAGRQGRYYMSDHMYIPAFSKRVLDCARANEHIAALCLSLSLSLSLSFSPSLSLIMVEGPKY